MAVEHEDKIKLSRRIASIWVVIAMAIALLIGVIGHAMTSAGVIGSLGDSETIIVSIAHVLSSHGLLFAIVAGVILAGILASTMSTSDSQLLAASSSITEDLMGGVFGIKLSPRANVIVARCSVIAISVVAIFLALDPSSNVFKIVSFAWAGFGASFGPIVLFSLFWKRTNRAGALAGMLTGGVMVFVWKYLIAPMGGILSIYELLPAFLCSCLAIIVFSLLTPAPSREIVEEFESV